MALPIVGASGLLIGADISPAMLEGAGDRLNDPSFWPVAADGQALPFKDGSFDAVTCQLGLQFFPDPALGLKEFRRVLRVEGCAAVCVISTPDTAPMWRSCGTAISDTQCESVPEACSRVASSRLALFGALIEEIRFAPDSPLEGTGFELLVPIAMARAHRGGRK
jgi:ubiquinone/menaquinone biosynthesis C-methylase UbiE